MACRQRRRDPRPRRERPPKIWLELSNNPPDGLVQLGGWGGIRTHGGLAPTAVFKTAALNHSATHPSFSSSCYRVSGWDVQGARRTRLALAGVSPVACRRGGSVALRLIGAFLIASMGGVASGPASAQADPLAPLPQRVVQQGAPQPTIQPVQTIYTQRVWAAPTGFEAYKQYLAARARREGIRELTIQANVVGLDLNRRAIELDQSQPGGPPNSSYIPPFAPRARISSPSPTCHAARPRGRPSSRTACGWKAS